MNSYPIFYILFAWTLGLCYGFVLLSSAAGHNADVNLFTPGEALFYKLHSSVLLDEKGGTKNVGFFVSGDVEVKTIWGRQFDKILEIQIRNPELHIRSRKAPSPDGFIKHSSKLEEFSNSPFFVVWRKGTIEKVYIGTGEPTSLRNLKKGIASLFQFQLTDEEGEETDTSGLCFVSYKSEAPNKFTKYKQNCLSNDFPYLRNSEVILSTSTKSKRHVTYDLDNSGQYLKRISSSELHEFSVSAKEELGNQIQSEEILTYERSDTVETIQGENWNEVVEKVVIFPEYSEDTLLTKHEVLKLDDQKSFSVLVNDLREYLKPNELGGLAAAKSFLKLIEAARRSPKEDIAKALGAKKNKKILHQICDILGFAQTVDAHEAVMKKLHLDSEDQLEFNERYLWASSLSSHPNADIVEDLLNKFKQYANIPEKVKQTLILTLASMSHRLLKTSNTSHALKIAHNVEETILNALDYSKGEEKYIYLRALANLKSSSTINTLLKVIKKGTTKEVVLAWKAIRSLPPSMWTNDILQHARRSFYQIDKKYDSSSRTIAADILLEAAPNVTILTEMINFLRSNDTVYEVKQYVFQRLQMLAQESEEVRTRILNTIKGDKSLNNYSVLAPRGLSTALKRKFLGGGSANGSLVSIQEISSGIVKRGTVNVVLDKDDKADELFSLGIFTGGLSSFLSSESEDEEESATAGLELRVLGTQLRPFVFFNGQGELMGHVWSGTASEKTSAYQALIMLHDHLEYLRLGSGFIAEIDVKGATSFDLSGKIEISIWNRNSESLVEKTAGIYLAGIVKIDTDFVRSQVEFSSSIEPKLTLQSDIDFSGNTKCCMRLTQPDMTYRHNVFKIERIPGSKHRLRIAKYKKLKVPGVTYSLNRKNNEMCSAIFK